MKKLVWITLLLSFGVVTPVCFGKILTWQNSDLNISAEAPPALVYVTDSNGNRTGTNPSAQLNANGQQIGSPFGLNEIPNSLSDQNNEGIGDINTSNFGPRSHTIWTVNIYDGGKQTYTINAKGLTPGVEKIQVLGLVKAGSNVVKSPKTALNILVNPGVTRQISLTFDPVQTTVVTQPIIGNSDLLNDVRSACALNFITSRRVCKHLEKKAEAIQDALDRHRNKEAGELVKSFLRSLGEDRGDGDNDQDDHDAIKEPALSILIADAKALLQTLPNDDHHYHGNK